MKNLSTRTKFIIGGGAFAILAILFVMTGGLSFGRFNVTVLVYPSDSTLTIDGQQIQAGQVSLTDGEHTIKATHEYFTDDEKIVNTKDLRRGETIYLTPVPTTPEAKQWLLDHPEANEKLAEEAGGAAMNEAQVIMAEKYPFLDKLPHDSIDFKVDYSLTTGDYQLSLQITLMPYANPMNADYYREQLKEFKEEALQWLRNNRIDPTLYPVTYTPVEATDL